MFRPILISSMRNVGQIGQCTFTIQQLASKFSGTPHPGCFMKTLKVRLEMTKTAQKLHSKFNMADFLLGLGYGTHRLLSKPGDVTSAYQMSFIYVKFKRGGFD